MRPLSMGPPLGKLLCRRPSSRELMSSNNPRSTRPRKTTTQDMMMDRTKVLKRSSTTSGEAS